MKRKLPPLKSVLAFEAAARHRSFKKAAEELCVTSSAVSHQVRALEEWLGVALFARGAHSAELTDCGRRYARELTPLLDRLTAVSNAERASRKKKKPVAIQTTDSFATRWLIPRLPEFAALHADAAVKIITHDFREQLRESEADAGILFMQSGARCDAHARLLFAEEIFPVCAPALLQKHGEVRIEELPRMPLIHDDNLGLSWAEWFHAAGKPAAAVHINVETGAHYNHSHLALHAAELGEGFALASSVLTQTARTAGRLTAPFAETVNAGGGYYLALPPAAATGDCKKFVDWILGAAGV